LADRNRVVLGIGVLGLWASLVLAADDPEKLLDQLKNPATKKAADAKATRYAKDVLEKVRARALALRKERKFDEAAKAWDRESWGERTKEYAILQEILRAIGDETIFKSWEKEREDAKALADSWSEWKRVERKCSEPEDDEIDGTIAKLKALTLDIPEAAQERDALVRNLEARKGGVEKKTAEIKLVSKERLVFQLESKAFEPILSPSNRENLVQTMVIEAAERFRFPWRVTKAENPSVKGKAKDKARGKDADQAGSILGADNGEGKEPIEIGMNGNLWSCYDLEFSIRATAGKVVLRTRTEFDRIDPNSLIGSRKLPVSLLSAGGIPGVRASGNKDTTYEFKGEGAGAWQEVRLRVLGSGVNCTVGGKELKPERTGDDENGGFLFVLEPGGKAEIREPRIRCVVDPRFRRSE
jgi:hypothetical protein